MSALKTILTRIQLKNDTGENWNKAVNFVPLDGEVIIYDVDETHSKPRIKIGDGKTLVSDLPFANEPSIEGETLVLN